MYNEKIDVWSLGVMLYQMVTGIPPFMGNNTRELYQSIIKGTYSLDHPNFQNVSTSLVDLIKRMLVINANQRISCEECLHHKCSTITLNCQ